MTTHQMIQSELAAAGLVMGDLTQPGWFHKLSNGRRIWVQTARQEEPIEDLFGSRQSVLTMTILCPDCGGDTFPVSTWIDAERRSYRKCSANVAHERVRVL